MEKKYTIQYICNEGITSKLHNSQVVEASWTLSFATMSGHVVVTRADLLVTGSSRWHTATTGTTCPTSPVAQIRP